MKKIDKHAFLNKVRIASPCSQDWEKMTGDERKRHCQACKMNVFNIEELSTNEAYDLIAGATGRVCIRLYRRQDGTVMTDDCPVALKRIRNFYRKCAVATIGFLIYSGIVSPNPAKAQFPWDTYSAELELKKRDLEAGMAVVDQDGNPVPRPKQVITPLETELTKTNTELRKLRGERNAIGLSLAILATTFAFIFSRQKKHSSIWIVGGSFALAFAAIGLIWQWYW